MTSNGVALGHPRIPLPKRCPHTARLQNVLCSRGPWQAVQAGVQYTIRPCQNVATTGQVVVPGSIGGIACTLTVSGKNLAWLHPAMHEADTSLALPEPVQNALVQLVVQEWATAIEAVLHTPCTVESAAITLHNAPAPAENIIAESDATCSFAIHAVPQALPTGSLTLFVQVHVASQHALQLARILENIPAGQSVEKQMPALAPLPVVVAVEAGTMRLPASTLKSLVIGSILLPQEYAAKTGNVRVRFGEHTVNNEGCWYALCQVHGMQATVNNLVCQISLQEQTTFTGAHENANAVPVQGVDDLAPAIDDVAQNNSTKTENRESTVTEEQENTGAGKLPLEEIAVALTFELERRTMTVQELAKVEIGYTFALGTPLDAPVTICVNGKSIGTGALVDLNGTLGIEVTQLAK